MRDPQYNLVLWALYSFGVPLDDFLPEQRGLRKKATGERADCTRENWVWKPCVKRAP